MGLSNKLSCEAWSFSHCCLNPYRCFQSEFLRLYFPELEPWVAQPVSLLSCSSQFSYTEMLDHLLSLPLPLPVHQLLSYCESSTPQQPISTCPTSVDECFFFNLLIVRLSYSLIFWQFWLFFVFKFVVAFILVVGGGKVYLTTLTSWPEVPTEVIFKLYYEIHKYTTALRIVQ